MYTKVSILIHNLTLDVGVVKMMDILEGMVLSPLTLTRPELMACSKSSLWYVRRTKSSSSIVKTQY